MRVFRARPGVRAVLVAAAGGLLVTVLAGLLVPLASITAHHTYDEARTDGITAAGVLAAEVSDAVARATDAAREPTNPGTTVTAAVSALVHATGMRVLVVDGRGRVLAGRAGAVDPASGRAKADAELAQVLADRTTPPAPVARSVGNELVVTLPVLEAGRTVGAVQVARPLSTVRSRTASRDLALAGLGALALVAGLGVAVVVSALLTRPVRRLGEMARRLESGDLDARAPDASVRELAELAEAFNAMATSLAANVTAQRDFSANASHQLKTPLTGLQLRLEAIATGTHGEVDPADEARKALADVARLNALTEDLLDLAHASAPASHGDDVDLADLADRVVERWSETASRRGKQLDISVGDRAIVHADAEDLEHLLDNLIDNAVRYSGDGAHIDVEVDGSAVSVADDGPPIPADERARIFERFFRGRQGRAVAPGTGLGLAVVVALAARWGGRVQLAAADRTRFEVSFPPAPERAGSAR